MMGIRSKGRYWLGLPPSLETSISGRQAKLGGMYPAMQCTFRYINSCNAECESRHSDRTFTARTCSSFPGLVLLVPGRTSLLGTPNESLRALPRLSSLHAPDNQTISYATGHMEEVGVARCAMKEIIRAIKSRSGERKV